MRLGNHEFVDGEDAKVYLRHLLAKYTIGSKITEPDDVELIADLVQHHPKWGETLKQNVAEFIVVRNRRQKATEIEVLKTDGQRLQVAWAECVVSLAR